MTRSTLRSAAFALTIFCASAASAQVPQTVAGRQFSAWLEAFNSGDREKIRRFLETTYPDANLDNQMRFRLQTGGFDFRKAEQSTATSLSGLLQEKNSDQFARFTLTLDPAASNMITQLQLAAIPRPAEFALPRLSEAELITTLRGKLEKDAADDRFAGAALIGRISNGTGKVVFESA